MKHTHHQIPTHLNVEDRVLFGLTGRQFLTALIGVSIAYNLWNQAALPATLRVGLAAAWVAATLVLALVRPGDRPLEQWALSAVVYIAIPRVSTWQPAEPELADWHAPADEGWAEAAPGLAWTEVGKP